MSFAVASRDIGRSQGQAILLPRSVSLSGVRATDLARESARHRSCLRAQSSKLYHMGFRAPRSSATRWPTPTLCATGASMPTSLNADQQGRELYVDEAFGARNWTPFMPSIQPPSICACRCSRGRRFAPPKRPSNCTRCSICAATSPPSSTSATARCTTSTFSTCFVIEPGAFYIMDRGYLDFKRLTRLDQAGGFFVTRAKSNIEPRRRYSPAGRSSTRAHLRSDHRPERASMPPRVRPRPCAASSINDPETGKNLVFLTNKFALPAMTIASSTDVDGRWNCSSNGSSSTCASKRFYGTSENAVQGRKSGGHLRLCARGHRQKTPRR